MRRLRSARWRRLPRTPSWPSSAKPAYFTIGTDAEGEETWTLTPQGVQVARQLAMGDEATFNAILDAVEARR